MNTLTYAFLVVMSINVMLFIGQAAMLDINPDGPQLYHCEGNLLGAFEATGCTTPGSYYLNNTDPTASLPSGETSVSPETGNIFTDAFTGIKSWFLKSTGLSYVGNILNAPYNVLSAILPGPETQPFVFAIGSGWYALTFFLLVAFLFGRDL